MSLSSSNHIYVDGGADGVFDILPLNSGGTGDMTVEMMMYYTDTTAWGRTMGISNVTPASGAGTEYLDLHGQLTTAHYLRNAGTNTPSGGGWTSTSYPAISTGAWHHCAMSASSGTHAFWIDGTFIQAGTTGAGTGGIIDLRYAFPTATRTGWFDNFRVSNTAR